MFWANQWLIFVELFFYLSLIYHLIAFTLKPLLQSFPLIILMHLTCQIATLSAPSDKFSALHPGSHLPLLISFRFPNFSSKSTAGMYLKALQVCT